MPPTRLIDALGVSSSMAKWLALDPVDAVENQQWLAPMGTLNAFVGSNNSGKSRALRELFRSGTNMGLLATDEPIRRAQAVADKNRDLLRRWSDPQGMLGKLGPQARIEGDSRDPQAFKTALARVHALGSSQAATGFLFGGNGRRLSSDAQQLAKWVWQFISESNTEGIDLA